MESDVEFKKATVNFKLTVPDGFKPGKCWLCPLAAKQAVGKHFVLCCKVGFSSAVCPISLDN